MAGLQAGWSRTRLRKVAGTVYVDKPNTLMRDVVVGRVVVRAPGFRAVNVMAVGGATITANNGLFDFTAADAAGSLQNCLVVPDVPSLWVTGVFGHDYVAKAVEVHTVTDGFGVYDTHRRGDPVNVTIDGAHVHDLTYFTHDPNHPDGHTHNDCVQIQGGSHVTITNSVLSALASKAAGEYAKDPYRPAVTGSAIAVTPNVSKVSWLHVQGNELDGGAQSITLIPGSFGKVNLGAIVGNTFGTKQANVRKGLVRARRPGVAHPDVTVDWHGNVRTTGGEAKLTVTKQV